jgi:hypothetical protein
LHEVADWLQHKQTSKQTYGGRIWLQIGCSLVAVVWSCNRAPVARINRRHQARRVQARLRSVAAVSRRFGRHRVFRQKQDYMIISKLAIIVGMPKIANLPMLVKNKQLKY